MVKISEDGFQPLLMLYALLLTLCVASLLQAYIKYFKEISNLENIRNWEQATKAHKEVLKSEWKKIAFVVAPSFAGSWFLAIKFLHWSHSLSEDSPVGGLTIMFVALIIGMFPVCAYSIYTSCFRLRTHLKAIAGKEY